MLGSRTSFEACLRFPIHPPALPRSFLSLSIHAVIIMVMTMLMMSGVKIQIILCKGHKIETSVETDSIDENAK